MVHALLNSPSSPIRYAVLRNSCRVGWWSAAFVLLVGLLPQVAIARTGDPARNETPTTAASEVDCERFAAALPEGATPAERCHAELLIARCLIVSRGAAPLSALWHGETTSPELADVTRAAAVHLDAAAEALERLPDETPAEIVYAFERRLNLLRSFHAMFAALAAGHATEEQRRALIDACHALAVYQDAERPGVIAAAKLWQGVAYRRAQRSDRALQVLRPRLGEPTPPAIGLMLRLERCCALADAGEYVAALALSQRLSGRMEGWFDGQPTDEAIRAAGAIRRVRVMLLDGWAVALEADGKTEVAAKVRGQADLIRDPTADDSPAYGRLTLHASIADLGEWEMPTTAPADAANERAGPDEAADPLDDE